MRSLVFLVIGSMLTALAAPPAAADHTRGASDSASCVADLCSAGAAMTVQMPDRCLSGGCYWLVECTGSARAPGVVEGVLNCGAVDISGNVDPTVGKDLCTGGPTIDIAQCSLGAGGTPWVYSGQCLDMAAEVATSPTGPIARAGPITVCVGSGGVPFWG